MSATQRPNDEEPKPEGRPSSEEPKERPGGTRAAQRSDLGERTARFGEAVIAFAKRVNGGPISAPLINQLVRAATSIGADYCEADDAESRKVFRLKIATCRKESKETKHWLRMIVAAQANLRDAARPLWREAKELNLIFSTIFRKMQ
jgi:four helix bundle protein